MSKRIKITDPEGNFIYVNFPKSGVLYLVKTLQDVLRELSDCTTEDAPLPPVLAAAKGKPTGERPGIRYPDQHPDGDEGL